MISTPSFFTVGEFLLLCLVPYPLVRLLTLSGFRRHLDLLPGTAAILLSALGLYYLVLTLLFLLSPRLLELSSAAAVVLAILAVWRARPAYGSGRQLPPGSLSVASIAPWIDRDFYHKQATRFGPIFKISALVQPCVCIVGLPLAREFLELHRAHLVAPELPFNRHVPQGLLRYAAPAAHRAMRPHFQAVFSSAVLRDAEPYFRMRLSEMLRAMTAQQDPRGIYPVPYFQTLLFQVMARLFFGLGVGTTEFSRFADLNHTLDIFAAARRSRREVKRALAQFVPFCEELCSSRASLAAQDNSYLFESVRLQGGTIRNPGLIYNLLYSMQIACSDVSGLFFWILKHLSDHPDWTEWAGSPDVSGPGGDAAGNKDLPSRIVFESLRLSQSEFLLRRTLSDLDFRGYHIPRGWLVRVCTQDSHRDPTVFDHPNCFDPNRFMNRTYSHSEFMPFGAFEHACLGQAVTLNLARTLVTSLCRHVAWTVVTDGPPEFNGLHWQPSSHFRARFFNVIVD